MTNSTGNILISLLRTDLPDDSMKCPPLLHFDGYFLSKVINQGDKKSLVRIDPDEDFLRAKHEQKF